MLKFINSQKMGRSRLGWLDSHFHFSFAEYYNPDNTHFGVLRVINDDLIESQTGFPTHPHKDFEIVSYVVNGELTHADSMDNHETLTRGQVQYMSAGTGVVHSEYNWGADTVRLLQIWFFPDKKGYTPNYGDYRFKWEDRIDRWMPLVSGDNDPQFPVQIHADVHLYATELARGKELSFPVAAGRQAYLVLIEGEAEIGGHLLKDRDALGIVEESIQIKAAKNTHILLLEMEKEQ